MLLRLTYLTITNAFAALRLLPMSDRDKDAEILALRHQIMLLERQLRTDRVQFTSEDRAFLAALLAPLPREVLRWLRLLVQTCRHELLDRALIWNERHLRHAVRQFEQHHNTHRPHQATNQAAPLRAVPEPIPDIGPISRLDIRRPDRLPRVIHEYRHAT